MEILFLAALFILGSCIGSFLCCQARRIKIKGNKKKTGLGSRSICLSCKTKLKWYDNIPIISWLILKGKCRKCHQKIGLAEILSELGLGLAFLALGTTINISLATPLEWTLFVIHLLLLSCLGFLAIYDGAYGELPFPFLILSLILALIIFSINEYTIISLTGFSTSLIIKPILSIIILGGLYLSLYLLSRGKWVGNGDWILGTIIAIVLFEPWLSLITLFLSNFLATIIMFPIVKKNRNHMIYFGPFLVIAYVLVLTFAEFFKGMI